jgi:small-conductance mechanosensitive channel
MDFAAAAMKLKLLFLSDFLRTLVWFVTAVLSRAGCERGLYRQMRPAAPLIVLPSRCRAVAQMAGLLFALAVACVSQPAWAQLGADSVPPAANTPPEPRPEGSQAPARVDVQPVARDDEIRARLESILKATGWFTDAQVRVNEGVVFLTGKTTSDARKTWAGDLARNTQDVVAVVNQMEVRLPQIWDLAPAREGLYSLGRDSVSLLPFLALGIIILPLAWFAGLLMTRLMRYSLAKRVSPALLREVFARTLGALVFLLGLYIVLRLAGLTRLALTVIGGTGLVGLVIGIAFRDITENFLASIFLSVHRPFEVGDLIEINATLGYVQRLTVRTTVLMTLDGNHVQIPNSAVYKSTIRNFTSNRNRREAFLIGIGFDVPIADAQAAALQVLREHPAVLADPEPWVLVNDLGAATVNLKVYFWLDGSEHSWLKVRSSVIRLVRRAFQEQGISKPDGPREIVFPHGVPLYTQGGAALDLPAMPAPSSTLSAAPAPAPARREAAVAAEPEVVSTSAEAGLGTDSNSIKKQAREARPADGEENLLAPAAAPAEKATS